MNENSFEWFSAEIELVRSHVEQTWPAWMKNTADVATASFPVVASSGKRNETCAKMNDAPVIVAQAN